MHEIVKEKQCCGAGALELELIFVLSVVSESLASFFKGAPAKS